MSQVKQTGVSPSLSQQLKKLNVDNPVTSLLREKKFLELMDLLLQKPELIENIYGDKIGLVLKNIRRTIEEQKEDLAELQFTDMMNKYNSLKEKIAIVHPLAEVTPSDIIRNHIRRREWNQLRDMFAQSPELFWKYVNSDKYGYIISSVRRYAFGVNDDQMHTPEYIEWRHKINAAKVK